MVPGGFKCRRGGGALGKRGRGPPLRLDELTDLPGRDPTLHCHPVRVGLLLVRVERLRRVLRCERPRPLRDVQLWWSDGRMWPRLTP